MKTNTIHTIALHTALALSLGSGLHAATKTVSVGNSMFGATGTASLNYYTAPQGSTCDFYATGKVDANVLYKPVNIASASANFRVNEGTNNTRAWGYLKAGSSTLATWDKSLTGSGTFATAPIISVQKGGSIDIWKIVTASASASAEIRMEGAVALAKLPGRRTAVTARFGPAVQVGATVSASVDAVVASAGIIGDLTVCDLSLITSAKMTPSFDVTKMNTSIVDYQSVLSFTSPSGKVTAWMDSPVITKKTKVIFEWTGNTSNTTLASGSFELRNSPILR